MDKKKTQVAAVPAPVEAADELPVVQSIKGFNRDLTCRGFQFEVGKTFEVSGRIKVCGTGFHACPVDAHPLSVFEFYSPEQSVYHLVEQSGATDRDDTKIASAKITIGVEIALGDLIQRAVDWVMARVTPDEGTSNSGEYGAASNSGTRGAASNSGEYGAASNSGYGGAASNSGEYGAASNSGEYGAASNSGTRGAASNSGTRGAASNSGEYGAASNSGEYGAASNSGTRGAASNSGTRGAAISHAPAGRVRAEGDNQALYCTEFASDWKTIKSVASGLTGQNGIKAATWYTCRDGQLVEVKV